MAAGPNNERPGVPDNILLARIVNRLENGLPSGEPINFVDTPPSTPTSAGAHPSIAVSNFHLYVTIADNTWRRVAIGSWS